MFENGKTHTLAERFTRATRLRSACSAAPLRPGGRDSADARTRTTRASIGKRMVRIAR